MQQDVRKHQMKLYAHVNHSSLCGLQRGEPGPKLRNNNVQSL